jgi:hypothetical protein
MSSLDDDDGGPAFPVSNFSTAMPGTVEEGKRMARGMSLRQHYAGLLMQGELTTCGVPGEACDALVKAAHDRGMDPIDLMAQNAMDGADALIRASACPPQRIYVPFDPATLTNDQRAAMDRLIDWLYFDDLPEDVKANAKAVNRFIQMGDDSIPF